MPRRALPLKNSLNQPEALGGYAPFLREVTRRGTGDDTRFPFSVPVIRAMDSLPLSNAVTFFVGENGSGKSTLLEAIAAAAKVPIGQLALMVMMQDMIAQDAQFVIATHSPILLAD